VVDARCVKAVEAWHATAVGGLQRRFHNGVNLEALWRISTVPAALSIYGSRTHHQIISDPLPSHKSLDDIGLKIPVFLERKSAAEVPCIKRSKE
jgi:hypothetical protein